MIAAKKPHTDAQCLGVEGRISSTSIKQLALLLYLYPFEVWLCVDIISQWLSRSKKKVMRRPSNCKAVIFTPYVLIQIVLCILIAEQNEKTQFRAKIKKENRKNGKQKSEHFDRVLL